LNKKIVNKAKAGEAMVIIAIGNFSRIFNSYSAVPVIIKYTGEKKHSRVPNITTAKRYNV
jgi:hypothetical protein